MSPDGPERRRDAPPAREGDGTPGEHPDVLGRLLAVEERLDRMLEDRRSEAGAIVREAREDAERHLERAEAEAREEMEARRRRILEEGRERAARARDEAAAAVRRWRGLPEADRDDLARMALERALRLPGREPVS